MPEYITRLTNLNELYLNNNQLIKVPESIDLIRNLNHLDLNNNKLTKLPVAIVNLTNLTGLNICGNSLPIPPEILEKIDEPTTIINYYLQHHRGQTKPLT